MSRKRTRSVEMVGYWLMKSEPHKFSIDDLQSSGSSPWDGVRNYAARNNMRLMNVGDHVLFYHSNAKPPGIAGLATVVRKAYPDHTALDPKSDYYDSKATEGKNPWEMVDVQFEEKFSSLVSLDQLKGESSLKGMQLFSQSRLSVQPVTKKEGYMNKWPPPVPAVPVSVPVPVPALAVAVAPAPITLQPQLIPVPSMTQTSSLALPLAPATAVPVLSAVIPAPVIDKPAMYEDVALAGVCEKYRNDGDTLNECCPTPPTVYPPQGKLQKIRVAPFGGVEIPTIFPAPVSLTVTESLSALPRQLAPPYVVFGGARYDQVPFVRRPPAHADPHAVCERAAATARAARRHIAEQLDLAAAYLRLEPRASPALSPALSPPRVAEAAGRRDLTPAAPTATPEGGAFTAKSIWTTAYAASVRELHALVAGEGKHMINAKGYVLYNRRQYGVKKRSEEFVLGLGQKASPLQFAALGGRLDNVVLLLHCGAKDDTVPRLRDILGVKVATVIERLRCGTRSKRGPRDSGAKAIEAKTDSLYPTQPRLMAEEFSPPL